MFLPTQVFNHFSQTEPGSTSVQIGAKVQKMIKLVAAVNCKPNACHYVPAFSKHRLFSIVKRLQQRLNFPMDSSDVDMKAAHSGTPDRKQVVFWNVSDKVSLLETDMQVRPKASRISF